MSGQKITIESLDGLDAAINVLSDIKSSAELNKEEDIAEKRTKAIKKLQNKLKNKLQKAYDKYCKMTGEYPKYITVMSKSSDGEAIVKIGY